MFKLETNDFQGGFCPSYWSSEFPSKGNANMSGDMNNVDLTSPHYITQAPDLSSLGTIPTLMRGMLKHSVQDNVSFGFGGDRLYKFSQTAILTDANFPRIISGAVGEDVELFRGKLFFSYNAPTHGAVGTFDLDTSIFNDAIYTFLRPGVPHQSVVAGSNGIYAVLDGDRVATFDTTWVPDAFNNRDINETLVSLAWNQNRFHIAGNKPNLIGNNRVKGSIYVWDGVSFSWETKAEVNGRIGALYVKDGQTFVFYQENLSEGVSTIGILQGDTVSPLRQWKGDLPLYWQVAEWNNFIIWVSGNKIMAFGSSDIRLTPLLFHLTTTTHLIGGGITSCFIQPIVASTNNTAFELARFHNFKTDSYWRGLLANIRDRDREGIIKKIRVNMEPLGIGAKARLILRNSKNEIKFTGEIATLGTTRQDWDTGVQDSDIRVELELFGSSTTPIRIRDILLLGDTLK